MIAIIGTRRSTGDWVALTVLELDHNMDPLHEMLPPFLDPVFELLQDNLPAPLYSFLLNVLSHSLALCTASFRLIGSLLGKNPAEWDLQTVLPPVVTILAAYLALASLYRTTTWLLRLTIWFIKWGSLLGVFFLGAGWLAAVTTMGGGGNEGLIKLGSAVSGWLNGEGGTTPRSKANTRSSRTKNSQPATKFEQIREWQYQEHGQQELNEAQMIMQNIVETANQVFDTNRLWQFAKVFAGSSSERSDDSSGGKPRNTRTRSR